MFFRGSSATPSDSSERTRLIDIFRTAAEGELFTLDDITEKTHSQRETTAFLLGQLAADHLIHQFLTVISPAANSGIRNFEDPSQIPDEIFDPFQMRDIEVEPSFIRVYFTKREAKVPDLPIEVGGADDVGSS